MLVPRPQDMNTCHIADVMLHPHRDGLALSSATAMARCMSLTERAQSATRGTGKLDDVDGPVDQTPYQSDATDTSELIVSPAALLRQPAAKDLWPPAWAEVSSLHCCSQYAHLCSDSDRVSRMFDLLPRAQITIRAQKWPCHWLSCGRS